MIINNNNNNEVVSIHIRHLCCAGSGCVNPIPCQGSLCHWRKIGYFTDSVQAPQKIGFCPGSSRWFLLDLSNEDMVI